MEAEGLGMGYNQTKAELSFDKKESLDQSI